MITDDSQPEIAFQKQQQIESDDLPFNENERLERDKQNIVLALKITEGKVSGNDGAATLLGIKPTTLASRMKSLGIN